MRLGSKGPEVVMWQTFLVGEGRMRGEVTGSFDEDTRLATIDFQEDVGLQGDGIVGPRTLSEAQARGLAPVAETTVSPLSWQERGRLFGTFAYRPAGSASDPEAIVITDGWGSKNIAMVDVPQLMGIQGAPAHCKVAFHKAAAGQFQALWAAWEEAGLLHLVKSWAGSWAPRFIRGSRSVLSNHAWGTAFDINAAWNGLGKVPAAEGRMGSVRELVPLAREHGFYWGGDFKGRPDGMHFEVCRLV